MEATKFTEVGFHGVDVDVMVKDLVETAITHTKLKKRKEIQKQVGGAGARLACTQLAGACLACMQLCVGGRSLLRYRTAS